MEATKIKPMHSKKEAICGKGFLERVHGFKLRMKNEGVVMARLMADNNDA